MQCTDGFNIFCPIVVKILKSHAINVENKILLLDLETNIIGIYRVTMTMKYQVYDVFMSLRIVRRRIIFLSDFDNHRK